MKAGVQAYENALVSGDSAADITHILELTNQRFHKLEKSAQEKHLCVQN